MENIINVEILGYTVAWYALGEAFYRITPVPPSAYKKLKAEEANSKPSKRKPRHGMYNNWVSFIHAVFIIATCGYCFLFGDDSLGREFTRFERLLGRISLAFYYYDTAVGYYYSWFDGPVYAHHFCCIFFWSFGLIGNKFAFELIKPLFYAELSHPLNVLRLYYTEIDHKKGKAISYLFYVVLFLFIRVFLSPTFFFYLQVMDYHISIKLFVAFIWFIGMAWAWMVLNLGAKEIANYFPSLNWIYEGLKKLRKYDKVYYGASLVWCCGGIVLYYLGYKQE